MSRASRQALVLLGAIHGGVRVVRDGFAVGQIRPLAEQADAACLAVANQWPTTGDNAKNIAWVADRLARWDKHLTSIPQQWSIMACISISIQALTDLYERTTNTEKRAMLGNLFAPLQQVHDFIDEKGTSNEAYEYAALCLESLYELIGFTENG